MKMFRRFGVAAALACTVAVLISGLSGHKLIRPAAAYTQILCAPNPVEGANARRVTNPVTGNAYGLNGQGCATFLQADVGYFFSQGFSPGPPFGSILFNSGVLTGTTSVQIGSIPAAAYIQHIIVNNLTANAVTGGIGFGSTSGGSDVVAPATFACGANCLAFALDSALLKRVFSTTAPQAIFMSANGASGAWNNANVNVTVVYGNF